MAFPLLPVVTWLTGFSVSALSNKNPVPPTGSGEDNGGDQPAEDTKSLQLEALKAIRESAAVRWDKRRLYEWQLSLSIWTATAAFSVIILNREHPLPNARHVAIWVAIIGCLISVAHARYVHSSIQQTMADVKMQLWAENAMHLLAFNEPLPNIDQFRPKLTSFRLVSKFPLHGFY